MDECMLRDYYEEGANTIEAKEAKEIEEVHYILIQAEIDDYIRECGFWMGVSRI